MHFDNEAYARDLGGFSAATVAQPPISANSCRMRDLYWPFPELRTANLEQVLTLKSPNWRQKEVRYE
jgi:hypothetical protein